MLQKFKSRLESLPAKFTLNKNLWKLELGYNKARRELFFAYGINIHPIDSREKN